MNGEVAIKYLSTRIGQLESDKAILLAQLEETKQVIEQLTKEVESWQQPNKKDGESGI